MKVDRRLGALLPFRFASEHGVAVIGDEVFLRDTFNPEALVEVLRISKPIGAPKNLSDLDFSAKLELAYKEIALSDPIDGSNIGLEDDEGVVMPPDLIDEKSSAPVVLLVNKLLKHSILSKASDLHLDPFRLGLSVKMRVDGHLTKIFEHENALVDQVISRIKILSRMDTTQSRLPQDGRFSLRMCGRHFDVRVSSMPSRHGERLVLRFLDQSASRIPLSNLGLKEDQLVQLKRVMSSPNGVLLISGPTGSGKTTTLYSLLSEILGSGRGILTLEDPIEYELEGVSQVQIEEEIGFTFAKGLRTSVRQDADVVMLGEIRDNESTLATMQAALAGRLVLTSIHANDAISTITRLTQFGADRHVVASVLRASIAQRLIRLLCEECKVAFDITETEANIFTKHGIEAPAKLYRASSCSNCANTGYLGRKAIFEVLEMSEPLARSILDEGRVYKTSDFCAPDNTLQNRALELARLGAVSIFDAVATAGQKI